MEKIYLKIGGFNLLFKLHYTDKRFHMEKFENILRNDYGGFIEKKKQKIDFTFNIYTMGIVILNVRKDVEKKNTNFNIRTFHLDEKKKILVAHNPPGSTELEFIINTVISKYLMPKSKAFIIHGSAVAFKNKSYIFEGKSGAGKSTTAQLLKGLCNVLADDLVIVRKIKNKFFLYQIMTHEKNYNFDKRKESYVIEKVFFIKKSDKSYVKEIKNKNVILKKMFKQIFTYEDEFKKQFEIFSEFINETKFYELYVKKDEKIFKEFFKKEILKI